MERRIYLSDYTWTEDDYIPGQIKFIMSVPERWESERSVLSERRIYGSGRGGRRSGGYEIGTVLHDDRAFSHESGQHLPYPQSDREGESRKEVTLAYIGGSITQGREQHRSIPRVMPISPISFSKQICDER